MGLQDDFAQAALDIFVEFSDFSLLADYVQKKALKFADYDPDTLPRDTVPVVEDFTIIPLRYSDKEIDGNQVQVNDRKGYVKYAELSSVDSFSTDDKIFMKDIPNSGTYEGFDIHNITKIPEGNPVLLVFQLRSSSK